MLLLLHLQTSQDRTKTFQTRTAGRFLYASGGETIRTFLISVQSRLLIVLICNALTHYDRKGTIVQTKCVVS